MILQKRLIVILAIWMLCAPLMGQLARGDKKFGRLSYAEAIKPYQKHLKKNPTDGHAIRQIAECYRRINDFENAEEWFSKAVKYRETDPLTYFYYGQALMNNNKWDQAVPWFEKYLQKEPGNPVGTRMLKSCQDYRQLMADSSEFEVAITNINTDQADFSPNILKDKIIFATSRRKGDFMFGWKGHPFLELFEAKYYGRPELGEPVPMKGKINSKLHEAHVTFSPDGETMFFSRNNIVNKKIGKSSEGIILLKTFRSDLVNGKWKELEGIPFNSDEYSVGHPALTPDGKTLYFVSDMPGGLGGTDLYRVTLDMENGNWGVPENLGPAINTAGNEMFPWVDKTGTLYFSSNGWVGLGGLDLFKAKDVLLSSVDVKNLGYPINSARDDFAMVYDEKRGLGFFSSNRANGVGDDDIYSFLKRQIVKGVVVDAVTGERIENAKVELYGVRDLAGLGRTDENGVFRQGLSLGEEFYAVASKQGYEEEKMRFNTKNVKFDDEIVVEIPLSRSQICPDPKFFLGTLVDEDGNPLPKRKVKVIEKEMVVETDENGNIVANLDPDKKYEFVYDGPDVKEPIRTEINTGALANTDTVKSKLVVPEPGIGDVFFIIYYDFDMFNIRNKDARPELDRVVNFMNTNPDVIVQLASHTDCRGTNEYNEVLSKNRAKEAFTYITNHGISKDRLTFTWKGEYELTNECADGFSCDEVAHQLNRRTEFKLMGKVKKYPD